MRGNIFMAGQAAPAQSPDEPIQASSVDTSSVTKNQTVAQNMALAQKPGSIVWWLVLLGLYLAWDVFSQHEKIKKAIEPQNIATNVYNIFWVTIAVVIGVNGANVLFTKLATMRIPLLSRMAGTLLPLFHL